MENVQTENVQVENKEVTQEAQQTAPEITTKLPESVSQTLEKAPEYAPNFKFKAGQKEHEIPEMLRGVVKDQASEKYIKEIMEKAYGIDSVKDRFNSMKQEFTEVKNAYTQVMQPITFAQEAYKRGDLDSVFETLRISREKVLQWAVEQVELSQLPPDQRQVYEGKRSAERRAWDLERQHQSQAQMQVEEQSKYLHQMLDLVLERPDYGSIAQSYDTRKGKEGAFRDLIKSIGESEFALTQKVLTPLEAAQKAVELLGEQLNKPQQAAAVTTPPATQTQATQAEVKTPEKKKTLPSIQGSKTSAPAKPKMKSLDDLKKARDEILAQ